MKRIKFGNKDVELRYANWIKLLIDLIKPNSLYLFGGRGVAKSTDIIAERSIDVIYDMPRASFAFVSDTYVNLMTNIVPSVLLGWERKKFYENFHYVVDKEPPDFFKKPFIKSYNYKHSISIFNGCKFFLISLDRPSSSAGISVVHHFGDEAKFLKKDKLKKLFPTLRGDYLLYKDSPYFMGQTFCSDMADPTVGEDDWMLNMEKLMDKEQIFKILQTAFVVNEIKIEYLNKQKIAVSNDELEIINSNLNRWIERYKKIRYNSVFFYNVSSFANADILTLKYFKNMLDTLGIEDFKTSVLGIKKRLEKGAMFYGLLSDVHFYSDGYNYEYYDKFGLKDNISQNSLGLRYCFHDKAIDLGFDAGNMCSLVIGQEQGLNYRILKNIYTLAPDFINELAALFVNFFIHHKYKVVNLYYDRSANNYNKVKQDFAGQLKKAIEFCNNKVSGWQVNLMNISQKNITHSEEYVLMNEIMSNKNKSLPKLLIDIYECKELKSSLELAPLEKDLHGHIKKGKKSEKLAIHKLPFESTNMSDAFKYLICREKYLKLIQKRITIGDIKII